jgi:glycerol 2-dehydrogenase (NADP+)
MHPLLAQNDLLEYCRSKGIVITAYTPTGYDTVRSHPVIQEIAKKHNVSGAQICLSWHAARGVVAVPRSKDPQRQKDNLTVSHPQ